MNWKFWQSKNRSQELDKPMSRYFKAASFNNTTDFGISQNINADLQGTARTLRYRARDMVNNNGFATGVIDNFKNNIVGPNGIRLTVQGRNANGQLDTSGNNAIENAWAKFSKYGICDVEGNKDLIKIQEMVMQAVAIDGEALILIHRGEGDICSNFKLEVLSVDLLADYITRLDNGNIVYMGVEIDEYSRPHAYWMRRFDVNDPAQRVLMNGTQYVRVPAEDVIHLYDVKYPKQMRGIPWLANSILNLHHISQLQAAELQMARLAALKRVMYKVNPDENYVADPNDMDQFWNVNSQLDAASIEVLQPGMEPVSIEWSTPNTGLADFTKTILRQVAAGVGASYNSIAKDLESISYSSARFGALEDRVTYQQKQRWFANAFMNRVYEEWLYVQLMYGTIKLPNSQYPIGIDKFDKFTDVKWTPRGFSSVDPQKEAIGNKLALGTMTTTFTEICAQTGRDFNEILTERIQEELLIKTSYEAAGLEPPALSTFIYGVPPEKEEAGEVEETKMPSKNMTGKVKD